MKALQAVKSNLPKIVANTCQLYFNSQFQKAEWNGVGWGARKNQANTHHLLVASGNLRLAVNNSLKHADFNRVTFAVDLPYAAVHNYGLRAGRGKGFIMPQRKFMGYSDQLRDVLKAKILKQLKSIFPK